MSQIARQLFTGDGVVIVYLLILAIATWLAEIFANAVGKGQFSNMIRIVAVFVGILLVISTIVKALNAIATFMGL